MAINKSIVPHAYKCTRCSIEDKRVVTSQRRDVLLFNSMRLKFGGPLVYCSILRFFVVFAPRIYCCFSASVAGFMVQVFIHRGIAEMAK